jgi:hypothetical protein
MRTSRVSKAPLSTGVVELIDVDTHEHIGMGCRITLGGNNVLATALHNLSGGRIALRSGGAVYNVERDWPTAFVSRDLDLILIEVPASVWSVLAVGTAKTTGLKTASAVKIHGVSQFGQTTVSYGSVVTKQCRDLIIRHSASTYPGYSGSPLMNMEGRVVGIHLGYDLEGDYNKAVALEQFNTLESDRRDHLFQRANDMDEMHDFEDHVEYSFLSKKGKGRVRTAAREYEVKMIDDEFPLTKSWADYAVSEDDDSSWEAKKPTKSPVSGKEENVEVSEDFRLGGLRTRQAPLQVSHSSQTTAGVELEMSCCAKGPSGKQEKQEDSQESKTPKRKRARRRKKQKSSAKSSENGNGRNEAPGPSGTASSSKLTATEVQTLQELLERHSVKC